MSYTLEQIQNAYCDKNNFNQELVILYNSVWSGYTENIRNNPNTTNPYLICASDKYSSAKVKIMFVGQETFGWGGEFDDQHLAPSVDDLMRLYNLFVNKDIGYKSPFWNFYWSVMKKEFDKCHYGYVFSNLIKIGRANETGFDEQVRNLTSKYFNVLRKEIEILSPDIIFFGTGPNYDDVISEYLGAFSIEALEGDSNIFKITFAESTMPIAYKTYHPGFLQRNALYDKTSECLQNLISAFVK